MGVFEKMTEKYNTVFLSTTGPLGTILDRENDPYFLPSYVTKSYVVGDHADMLCHCLIMALELPIL